MARVSMESFVTDGGAISMEEEQVMMGEAAADAAEIATEITEAERVVEVSNALEDLAAVADQIEEASPAETALVEIAGDMAVAGTDIQPDEIVPVMESYRGGKIATEGLKERAVTMVKNIIEFVKSIWERIKKFFYNIFGAIPSMRKRVKSLKEKAEATYNAPALDNAKKTFPVKRGVASLCVDMTPVKTAKEVSDAVTKLQEAADFVYGPSIERRAELGKKLAEAIADFDPTKADGQAKSFAEEVGKFIGSLKVPGTSTAPAQDGFDVTAGNQLLGNVRLMRRVFKSTGKDVLADLDAHRRSGVELTSSREKGGSIPGDFAFNTMKAQEAEEILTKIEKILDVLEDYNKGKNSKSVDDAKKKMEDASAKATKSFDSMSNAEEGSAERSAYPIYKAMVGYNVAYARWVQSPAVTFANHVMTELNAVMTVVQASLAQY